MLIVGELINASRKSVKKMIKNKDAEGIQDLAKKQVENGADYVDVNAGIFSAREPEYLEWLVRTVQEVTEAPCCLDSANGEAIEKALAAHKGKPLVNSISMDSEQQASLLPVIKGTGCKIIGLCMGDRGTPPTTAEDRMAVADDLVGVLNRNEIPTRDIYLDPLVPCLSSDDTAGIESLKSISLLMERYEGIHTIAGVSNISYGLPKRKIINRAFMIMAIHSGMDAAILDPTDRKMMSNILAADALMGRDTYCEQYLMAYRDNKLEV